MKMIFQILVKTDIIKAISLELGMQSQGLDSIKQCECHQGATRYSIKECPTFKVEV